MNFRQILAAETPALAQPLEALYASAWRQSHLPGELLELCRLRLAQLHRCDAAWQRSECELDPRRRDSLDNWHRDGMFSEAERACLEFTEVYAMDVQAIRDEQAAAVVSHFGEAGLVLLIEALGLFDGMTRLELLWPEEGSRGQ